MRQKISSRDIEILEEGEVVPVNLKNHRRGFRIRTKRAFLGLTPTGKKAEIGFECQGEHNQIVSCLVKQRDTGAAALSNGFVEFTLKKNFDTLEVEQMDPGKRPSQKIVLDLYDMPFDSCLRGSGNDPNHEFEPHAPGCPHHVTSVTIRFSLAYAKLLAFAAALALFTRGLPDKIRERLSKVPESFKRFRQSASESMARASKIPAQAEVTTKIAGAHGRNHIRHLPHLFRFTRGAITKRRPLLAGIALIAILGLAGLSLVSGIVPRVEATDPGTVSVISPEEVEVVCEGGLTEAGHDKLEIAGCYIAGYDGPPPDEIVCGKGHRLVKTDAGVIIAGCEVIWK